jgi:hypothetical protein
VLRPPVNVLVPMTVTWVVATTTLAAGPLLVASADGWQGAVGGGLLSIVVVALYALLALRAHRLSQRWLVVVPAGLVVHDAVVLGETLMARASTIRGASLALAGTEALDLTGPAAGHAVEITFERPVDVVIAPTRRTPNGTAFHARSVLVAPTRPGAALRAAASRRIPVG